MPRYKLTVEYDGTPFCGWQKQDGQQTVQGALEAAFAQFMQQPVDTVCAGRTDAGVHGRGQVVHVDLHEPRPLFNIREGVNTLLRPHPVAIVKAEEAADDFHARFDAKKRHYLYRIINRPARLALDGQRAWHIHQPLDLAAMQEAANLLLGTHDFTSFRASECQSKNPTKTLDELRIASRSKNPEQVMIYTSARSFLHHQVRNIVGTLSLVGMGKWKPEQVRDALEAKDRSASGPTAPAHGLYFMQVDY